MRLLPPRFFFHHTLLPHHKKLLSCHLYGATKLLQALPPFELAQEARAPRSFSIKPQDFINKEGVIKAEFVRKLHEKVSNKIQQQSEKYDKQNNKGNRGLIF